MSAIIRLSLFSWCWIAVAHPINLLAQDVPSHRLFALANTSDVSMSSPLYKNLRIVITNQNIPTTVLVNGDFTDGHMNFPVDSAHIVRLMSLVEDVNLTKLVFIPGDRDWSDSGEEGWDYLKRLEKLVDRFDQSNVIWVPENGCPGPKKISLGDHLVLIAIQTQWWNHPFGKPLPANADCKIAAKDEFNEELNDLIEEDGQKNILIAGHFPVESYGSYGGKWPLSKYFLPIPVVSSLRTSFRSNAGTPKDISNHYFEPFRELMQQVLLEQHQLIYLSGHEHNLQVLKNQDHYLINSGSPSHPAYTRKSGKLLYGASEAGIIELRYYPDGTTDAVVHGAHDHELEPIKRIPLYGSFCDPSAAGIVINSRVNDCHSETPNDVAYKPADALTTVVAGSEYKAGRTKQSWLGRHYRKSWTTPVKVPYLNLDTTFLGLTPFQRGGGRQTTSLKLRAANGRQYVFRSVNKDPTKALDYEYRETVVGKVVRDQTSSQQPYGALAADALLNQLDILHPHPKLFVMPPNPVLKQFLEDYGGLLGMLEEHPTNPKNISQPFAQADYVMKSYRMFRELYEDHDHRVNVQEFARARVFDLLVGDWGKHEDNWKWAGYRGKQGITFRPIPRDRDHVFSLWDGILPWLADREWAKPSAANFGFEIKGIKSLMWQARHLDRFLGSELDRQHWLKAAYYIQNHIDSSHIAVAVGNMPPEIYQGDGATIEQKLRHRLDQLDEAAETYYELIAKEVDVVGSNKRESFEVFRAENGSVEVTVLDIDSETGKPDSSRIYYHRKFLPKETEEIRLFGLQKADDFHIFGKAKKSIPVRVIGGPGADRIFDESEVAGPGKKTKVYEQSENSELVLGNEGKLVSHWDPEVFNYDRTAFAYNKYFPLIFISSSKDFGFGVKAGIQFTNQRFGKQDFSANHAFQLAVSSEDIRVLDYRGKFRHVLGRWDLILEALAADHYYFTYFFGIGNDTEKDDALFEQDYYRTSYNSYQFTTGLQHQFWKGNNSNLAFKLHYENNQEQIDPNTIIKDPEFPQEILGAEDINLLEMIADLDLDFRDRSALPERGMRLKVQHQSGLLTSEGNEHYGVTQGFLESYISGYLKRPVTLGFLFGGSKSYGEVPFYKLRYLGQTNNLRGYLRNRYTGTSTIFFNTEIRWELSEFHTALFPVRFGLRGFYDTGRVYSDYDLTNQWHHGYGGGFYLIPLKEEFSINLSLAFSEEESGLFLLGIGRAF